VENAPGVCNQITRLQQKCDESLSNFDFNCNVRRYDQATMYSAFDKNPNDDDDGSEYDYDKLCVLEDGSISNGARMVSSYQVYSKGGLEWRRRYDWTGAKYRRFQQGRAVQVDNIKPRVQCTFSFSARN
jgi:hypothetical protein